MVERPQDVTVTEGESARFSCRLAGMQPNDDPIVDWFFQGRPAKDEEIYRHEHDPDDCRYTLVLPEALPEDEGVYTVRASCSSSGIVEASAILTVHGES